MSKRFYIADAGQYVDQEVLLNGWVVRKRSSGKKIKFLVLRDGTGIMQCVVFQDDCSPTAFEAFDQLNQEASVRVTGTIRKEPRSPGGYEMGVRDIQIQHASEGYPITPKEHGIDFLMNHRHLWVRSSKQHAALRVRAEIIKSIHQFFYDRGFVHFDAPILTPSACEGTSTLFETNYFDQKAFLTQSGQLYAEVGAMAFGKTYVFGPTFRAEKSKTRKHLTEFWMVEPEVAWADLNDNMELGDEFVSYIVQNVLKKCTEELTILERDTTKLESITTPFPRISYDDALKILEKHKVGIPWGEDFGAPQETALGLEFDNKPVWVHRMPQKIKAFYFKRDENNEDLALGCDLIAPEGYGELIGGGQREDDYDTLLKRIKEHDLPIEDYQWYLDLRKYGSVPHSGFGLGIERTVAWMCGLSHVRETIPFPRMIYTLRP